MLKEIEARAFIQGNTAFAFPTETHRAIIAFLGSEILQLKFLYKTVFPFCSSILQITSILEVALHYQNLHLMKSTKVQNPRCIPRIKPIMRAYWPPIALQLLTGQYSLLRRPTASCIVWDKAEPAIRTILHDALNGQ